MNYRLLSASTTLVDIPSSSSLDNPEVRETRRGTVFRTLKKNIVQYAATVLGERRIEWTVPRADTNQYGVLYSASVGAYGDTLTFASPVYGNISVAFMPGEDGFRVERHPGQFGYRAIIQFVRLA